eukprot:5288409-Pleurochrysis_carterae.AAC.1
MRAHTVAYARARAHAHTHAYAYAYARTHARTRARAPWRGRAHAYVCAHVQASGVVLAPSQMMSNTAECPVDGAHTWHGLQTRMRARPTRSTARAHHVRFLSSLFSGAASFDGTDRAAGQRDSVEPPASNADPAGGGHVRDRAHAHRDRAAAPGHGGAHWHRRRRGAAPVAQGGR